MRNASNQISNKMIKEDFNDIVMEAFHDVFAKPSNSKDIFVAEVKEYLDDVQFKANIEGVEEGLDLLNRFYDFLHELDEAMEGLMHMLMDLLQILIVKVHGHNNITGQYKLMYS